MWKRLFSGAKPEPELEFIVSPDADRQCRNLRWAINILTQIGEPSVVLDGVTYSFDSQ